MSKRILVLSDDGDMIAIIKSTLENFSDYELVVSADEKFKKIHPQHYGLSIIDLEYIEDTPQLWQDISFYSQDAVVVVDGETKLKGHFNKPYGLWLKPIAVLTVRNELTHLRRYHRRTNGFMALISHEFKGSLSSILGWSQILLGLAESEKDKSSALTDMQKQAIGLIYDIAKHLLTVIDDLRDAVRIDANDFPISPASVALQQLIAEGY
jgi:signal transduction histidine kinase